MHTVGFDNMHFEVDLQYLRACNTLSIHSYIIAVDPANSLLIG